MVFVTAVGLATLLAPTTAVVWLGQTGTAVVGAVIGPALTGLTLGLVGERLFGRQIARNEVWNHVGNVAYLAAVFLGVSLFGEPAIIALMLVTATGAVVAVLAIDPTASITQRRGDWAGSRRDRSRRDYGCSSPRPG